MIGFDPQDFLRWFANYVMPWVATLLIGGVVAAIVWLPIGWALDLYPFTGGATPAALFEVPIDRDPCCDCEADLADCEADRDAWREQAVRCVDDVLEVHAR